jgi:hypothetical protein
MCVSVCRPAPLLGCRPIRVSRLGLSLYIVPILYAIQQFILLHGIRGLGLGFPPISHSSRHRLPCRRPREAPSSLSGAAPNPIPVPPTFPPLPFSKAQGSTRRAGATAMAPARARQFRPRRDGQAPDAALGGAAAGADSASQAQPRLQHGRMDPARYDPARGTAAWPRRRATPRRARPQHARAWPRRRRGVHLRPGATASFEHEPAPACAHIPASGGGSQARLHPPPSRPPRRPPPSSSPRRPWRPSSQLLPHLPLVLGLHQVMAFTTSPSWPLSPTPSSPCFLYNSRCSSSLCFLSGRLAPCSAGTSPRTPRDLPPTPMTVAVSSQLSHCCYLSQVTSQASDPWCSAPEPHFPRVKMGQGTSNPSARFPVPHGCLPWSASSSSLRPSHVHPPLRCVLRRHPRTCRPSSSRWPPPNCSR